MLTYAEGDVRYAQDESHGLGSIRRENALIKNVLGLRQPAQ